MDFKQVIEMILRNFKEHHVEYAFIGGFAMGALGIMRSTVDIDLLVNKKDLKTIDHILTSHLYRLKYQSENVSQYVSDIKPLGNIDLLHAFRNRALSMLQRAQKIPIWGGQYEINVLIPEDIIGLKLQAMVNNPDRKTLECADIELLVEYFYQYLDWELLEDYFTLFQEQEYLETLTTKYGQTE
jgi:hypothetical protein